MLRRRLQTAEGQDLDALVQDYDKKRQFAELQLEVALKGQAVDAEKAAELLDETRQLFVQLNSAIAGIFSKATVTSGLFPDDDAVARMEGFATDRTRITQTMSDFDAILAIPIEVSSLQEVLEAKAWLEDPELMIRTYRRVARLYKRKAELMKQSKQYPEEKETLQLYDKQVDTLNKAFWEQLWQTWREEFIALAKTKPQMFDAIIQVVEEQDVDYGVPGKWRRKLSEEVIFSIQYTQRLVAKKHIPTGVNVLQYTLEHLDDLVDRVFDVQDYVVPRMPPSYDFGDMYLTIVHSIIKTILAQMEMPSPTELPAVFLWISEYEARIMLTGKVALLRKLFVNSNLSDSLSTHIHQYVDKIAERLKNAVYIAVNSIEDTPPIADADDRLLLADGLAVFKIVRDVVLGVYGTKNSELVGRFIKIVREQYSKLAMALKSTTRNAGGKKTPEAKLRILSAIANTALEGHASVLDLQEHTAATLGDAGDDVVKSLEQCGFYDTAIVAIETLADLLIDQSRGAIGHLYTVQWMAAARDGWPDPSPEVCEILGSMADLVEQIVAVLKPQAMRNIRRLALERLAVKMLQPFFKDTKLNVCEAFASQFRTDIDAVKAAFSEDPLKVSSRVIERVHTSMDNLITLLRNDDDTMLALSVMNLFQVVPDITRPMLKAVMVHHPKSGAFGLVDKHKNVTYPADPKEETSHPFCVAFYKERRKKIVEEMAAPELEIAPAVKTQPSTPKQQVEIELPDEVETMDFDDMF
ncbi:Exocyst complex component Sec6 [Carpediemonas membranifera]|uniref:Exocyst complex component Sec6 n=1 Tax=Carpediemonas membranifera TaxID=201153 RepID=A0A8J6BCD4_9EUKA|nr:Exocyst complex component Sec6 [Carpediemonas membranifera]|eukprot:KAG9397292.1 Exocyst complex component Sec6 [Carpediemonas membranifera]